MGRYRVDIGVSAEVDPAGEVVGDEVQQGPSVVTTATGDSVPPRLIIRVVSVVVGVWMIKR